MCSFYTPHVENKIKGCFKRVEGITDTVVASVDCLVPGIKIIGVVDNESIKNIIKKGPGIEELCELGDFLFLFCFCYCCFFLSFFFLSPFNKF